MPNEEDEVDARDSLTQFEEFVEESIELNIEENEEDVEPSAD